MGSLLCLVVAVVSAGTLALAREPRGAPASTIGVASPTYTMSLDQITPAPALWPDRFPYRQPSTGPAAAPSPAGLAADGPATAVAAAAETPSAAPEPAPAVIAAAQEASPAPPSETTPARLAREAGESFGIRIVLDGQDWGPDEASRQANIAAVISVMERLPQAVLSALAGHPYGPLTFISNMSGRTLDGWQPYGDFPMGFYTNSDQGADGSHAANEIVLIPGFSDMSIGHEVLHAYHFRDAAPGRYAAALLGDEMRSFMAATGWRQVGSDQQVLEATDGPWGALNSAYVYEGRPLTYETAAGTSVTLTPPNPLETFAVAGSIYFTRPSGMRLPDWPEYWAWFAANLGSGVA